MKCPAVLRCSGNKDPSGRKHNTGLSSKIFFGADFKTTRGGRLEGWVGKGSAERDLLQSFSGLGKQRPIRPPMDIYQFH